MLDNRLWRSGRVRLRPSRLPFSSLDGQASYQRPRTAARGIRGDMRVCILGATGLVGRELLELIDRAWPGATLDLYASRDQTLEYHDRMMKVEAASKLERDDVSRPQLAFVALDDEYSARYVPRLLALGSKVVDKSNAFRMDPKVPLVVAGVNANRVDDTIDLVANPNCTTIPFALAVAPLSRRWELHSATVSTYQAISGAGLATLDEFLRDVSDCYRQPNRLGTHLDVRKYAGNVVPHAAKTDESGFSSEERKLVFESRKILELPQLLISAQCCRVPVAVGHYENAWVGLGQAANVSDLAAVLGHPVAAPFVRCLPGPEGEGLTALACVHDRDTALVGRIRRDFRDDSGRTFCLTIAADNLRLGAATNAVRIASRWFPVHDEALQAPA